MVNMFVCWSQSWTA